MLEEAIKKEYQKYLKFIFAIDKEKIFSIQQIFEEMEKQLSDDSEDKYPKMKSSFSFHYRDFEDEVGNLIFQSDQFDYVRDSFHEERAVVKKGVMYNFIDLEGNLFSKEWFENAQSFHNGYAIVRSKGKYNFIDKEGNFLLENWQKYLKDFEEGYAIVIRENGEYNFIDKEGNFLLETWYDDLRPFQDDYALVKQNDKWNIIDKKGHLISDNWYDRITDFYDGIASVRRGDQWNFMDTKGRLLSDTWYDEARNNQDDTLCVSKNGKWNVLGKDGKPMLKTWYDEPIFFEGNVAYVQKGNQTNLIDRTGKELLNWSINNKMTPFYKNYSRVTADLGINFIDREGNFLLKKWIDSTKYDVANKFEEYILVVDKVTKQTNFLKTDGTYLFEKWSPYSFLGSFKDGCITIANDRKRNFINLKGELVSQEFFDGVQPFEEGYAVVTKDRKKNLLKPDGTYLLTTWYDDIRSFKHGHAMIGNGSFMNCIDQEGNLLFDHWYDDMKIIADRFLVGRKHCQVFLKDLDTNLIYGATTSKEDIDLAYYTLKPLSWKEITIDPKKINKTILSYQLEEKGKRYSLKYEPVRIYDSFILCKKKDTYYLYDKTKKDYQLLGKEPVTHGKNFFTCQNRTFFVTDVISEITGVPFHYSLELKPGIEEILSYEKFKKMIQKDGSYEQIKQDIEEKQKKMEQEKLEEQQRIKKEQEEKDRKELEERLKKQEEEHLQEFQEIEKQREFYLKMYQELTQKSKKLKEHSKSINQTKKIEETELFIQVGDHKEIDPIYPIDHYIREFDLSYISFQNVKVSGIDLSYTNAIIDPQTVYQKDMSHGNYNGLSFIMKDFTDVLIDDSTFEQCNFDFSNFSDITKKR